MLRLMAGNAGDDDGRNNGPAPSGRRAGADRYRPESVASGVVDSPAGRPVARDAEQTVGAPPARALRAAEPSGPLPAPPDDEPFPPRRSERPYSPAPAEPYPPPLRTPAHGVPIPAGSMMRPPAPSAPRDPPFSAPFAQGPFGGRGPTSFATPSPFPFIDRRTPSPPFGTYSTPNYGGSVLTPAHGVPAASGPSASTWSQSISAYGVWPNLDGRSPTTSTLGPPARGVHPISGARGPTTSAAQSANRSVWARSVERFWKSLIRAVVGARMYPADNPVQADYVFHAHAFLSELTKQQSPLTVTVRGSSLYWQTELVYDGHDGDNGLLAALAREGLELLAFRDGIQRSEIQGFVGVLSSIADQPAGGEVKTRLWCLDAPHIHFTYADPFDPVAATTRALTAEYDQYRQLILQVADNAVSSEMSAEALAGWSPPPPLPWIQALDAELSERRSELAGQDGLTALMGRANILLLGALGAEAEPTVDTPAWRLLTELLRAVVGHGHFADARSLLDRMDEYARRASSPNVKRMVEGVRRWLGSEEMIRAVTQRLEQMSDASGLEDGVAYLLRVGPAADRSLWKLSGQLRSDVARHHLAELLVRAAERDPSAVTGHLATQPQAMIVDLVARAEQRRSAAADAIWWFGLEHRDAAVRAPATKLLRRRDGPVTESVLLNKLDDHDPQVRMAALEAIGGRPRQALLNQAQSYFKLDRLERTSEAELGLAMVAFARILGARAVPQLAHVLNEGHRLRLGSKAVEVQIKAAQVLGAIADPAAVRALQSAAQNRNTRIRTACQKALDGYFGQTLNVEPVPDLDLSPRAGSAKAPRRPRTEARPEAGGRRLAKGIVGLPSNDDGGPFDD